MSSKIKSVNGFRIWDSRGRPTVEVEVQLESGAIGLGIAPAGASRGSNEAIDLRDGGTAHGGFGVDRAVANVNGPIRQALIGLDAIDQAMLDAVLIERDGTANKSVLGGNAIVATSMAMLKAAAAAQQQSVWRYLSAAEDVTLPLPQVQIFGGGAHAGRRTDIQDFLVMPVGAQSFDHAMVICADIYRTAGQIMLAKGAQCGVADEGGWWPNFDSNEQALETLTRSIDQAGYGHGQALIALDIAASEFGRNGRYRLALDQHEYDTDAWLEVVSRWVARYPIISIEDPVAEDDQVGMQKITTALGHRIQIIGDDFLVTNAQRVTDAQKSGACNAVLIKPNQAGTITETLATFRCAKSLDWGTIVSARSGETEDTLIAHLAVGLAAGQLKVGSFARSERMAKWNECLRIERSGDVAVRPFSAKVLPVPVPVPTLSPTASGPSLPAT